MRISRFFFLALLNASLPYAGLAAEHNDSSFFHYVRLEMDEGYSHDEAVTRWDLDGWIGGDSDKLWVKSEGAMFSSKAERTEFWGMYSRSISDFWDVQAGIRQDTAPVGTTYLTIGFDGLAPHFFETEAHIFLSDKGDICARIKERNDLLITQRLITQPYLEVNLFPKNVPERDVGAGITGEVGLQTRYEFTRQFAPYIDVRYEDALGNAGKAKENAGESKIQFITSIGLRIMF